MKLIPSATIATMDIIKSYFSIFNKRLEKKARIKRLKRRLRRISSNKFYISNGGFKHTNNKLIVNLYVFNRQKHNYLSILKNRYLKRLYKKQHKTAFEKNVIHKFENLFVNLRKQTKSLNVSNVRKIVFNIMLLKNLIPKCTKVWEKVVNKLIGSLKKQSEKVESRRMKFNSFKTVKFMKNNSKIKLHKRKITKEIKFKKQSMKLKLIKKLRLINVKGVKAIKIINDNKILITKALNTVFNSKNIQIRNINSLYKYAENFYKKLIKKSLRKIHMLFYYKQLLFINRSKVNYNYLQHLKIYLQKIYNKNVEFNIINVKRFYLNSDILSESITMKISKNRKKMRKYLNKLTNKIKVWNVKPSYKENISLNKSSIISNLSRIDLKNHISKNLKYKHITGFRLEAKGRLSKRFTASRSLSKVKYKGNLLDVNASYRGMPSNMLKGNLKPNTQYTKIKSKSRTGSFGIKGWVNGN